MKKTKTKKEKSADLNTTA